ncbi:MAG: hypothetical protein AAGC71_12415 [Pseudomonadota bacterium]
MLTNGVNEQRQEHTGAHNNAYAVHHDVQPKFSAWVHILDIHSTDSTFSVLVVPQTLFREFGRGTDSVEKSRSKILSPCELELVSNALTGPWGLAAWGGYTATDVYYDGGIKGQFGDLTTPYQCSPVVTIGWQSPGSTAIGRNYQICTYMIRPYPKLIGFYDRLFLTQYGSLKESDHDLPQVAAAIAVALVATLHMLTFLVWPIALLKALMPEELFPSSYYASVVLTVVVMLSAYGFFLPRYWSTENISKLQREFAGKASPISMAVKDGLVVIGSILAFTLSVYFLFA